MERQDAGCRPGGRDGACLRILSRRAAERVDLGYYVGRNFRSNLVNSHALHIKRSRATGDLVTSPASRSFVDVDGGMRLLPPGMSG